MLNSIWNLLDPGVRFVETTLSILASMSPIEFVLFLWPFLFLELPRHLFTEIWYLRTALKKLPSEEKLRFVLQLSQEQPLVSVLLPGYNEEDSLEISVQSLLEQSYPNLEIIVVNDGSKDKMGEVARRLAERGWVRFFNFSARAGKQAAANFALGAARGEYVVICDCDTTYDNDAILHMLAEFYDPEVKNHGEVGKTVLKARRCLTERFAEVCPLFAHSQLQPRIPRALFPFFPQRRQHFHLVQA